MFSPSRESMETDSSAAAAKKDAAQGKGSSGKKRSRAQLEGLQLNETAPVVMSVAIKAAAAAADKAKPKKKKAKLTSSSSSSSNNENSVPVMVMAAQKPVAMEDIAIKTVTAVSADAVQHDELLASFDPLLNSKRAATSMLAAQAQASASSGHAKSPVAKRTRGAALRI